MRMRRERSSLHPAPPPVGTGSARAAAAKRGDDPIDEGGDAADRAALMAGDGPPAFEDRGDAAIEMRLAGLETDTGSGREIERHEGAPCLRSARGRSNTLGRTPEDRLPLDLARMSQF